MHTKFFSVSIILMCFLENKISKSVLNQFSCEVAYQKAMEQQANAPSIQLAGHLHEKGLNIKKIIQF